MSGVLDELVASARARLPHLPLGEPRGRRPSFSGALRGRDHLAVIAEVKRASPSRGVLAAGARAGAQARLYAAAGARAISVLTEPTRFSGSYGDLEQVAEQVSLPLLMKDFVIDPDQVRAGALLGASAVLAIVRILEGGQLAEILAAAGSHGLEALVECHSEREITQALAAGARVLGVNNRDLDTLEVDTGRARELLPAVPEAVIAVAESGYESSEDAASLRGTCDAVLVGSALMTSADPGRFIEEIVRCR